MDNVPNLVPSPQAKRRRTSKRRRNNTEDVTETEADVKIEMLSDEPVASTSSAAFASTDGMSSSRDSACGSIPVVYPVHQMFHLSRLMEPTAVMTPNVSVVDMAVPIEEPESSGSLTSVSAPGWSNQHTRSSIPVVTSGVPVHIPRLHIPVTPILMEECFEGVPEVNEEQIILPVVNPEDVSTQQLVIQRRDLDSNPAIQNQGNQNHQQSLVDDHGWQESRLLLTARSKFLLNNSRMSDIRFLVGETNVEIFGHKTILAMGSPVFEAQFFGSLKSDVEVIELPDLEPETFLLFLKYLYTDTLDESIDDMKVLQLLRPAKKYIVPHLIEKCSDILMSELRAENVFQVYNYAVFFDLKKLEGACLRFLDRECEAIIQTEEFTMLNQQNLADFLKRDGLNIKEHILFKAVLRWSELECERLLVEPTDSNIRGALADNLRLIRFPTMSAEEFATEVASRNILTAEESRSIFIFMCSGHHNRLPALTPDFPVKKRSFYPQQYLVSRFSGEPLPHSLNYRSGEIYTYRINFKADRQIFFKGVNIFSIKCGMNAQYVDQRRFNGAVYLFECDVVAGDRDLSRKKAHKQFTRESSLESEHETSSGSRYFPVLFDQELRIPANQMFTISAVVSVASSSYQQQPLNTCMGTDEVTTAVVKCAEDLHVNFTFSNCFDGEPSVGKYTQSQIPEIVFSL